jgi:hypothetical protein
MATITSIACFAIGATDDRAPGVGDAPDFELDATVFDDDDGGGGTGGTGGHVRLHSRRRDAAEGGGGEGPFVVVWT